VINEPNGRTVRYAFAATTTVVSLAAATLPQSESRASTLLGEGHLASNGAWIAYSTAPAIDQSRRPGGSDVFLVGSGGGRPRLIAGRGSGNRVWNLCPVFSPDGAMLAFKRKAPGGRSIVVVGVTRDGTTRAPKLVLKVPGKAAGCPRWSSDGSRLAYLGPHGAVVVRGLDGSIRQVSKGDPAQADFNRPRTGIRSPNGELLAERSDCGVVVARRDGSQKRVVADVPLWCPYAIAGWSPDGRKLLLMRDVSGRHFTMSWVSVQPPFLGVEVAVSVRVNDPRSWPGYGDVSWQPRPR
jgi:Tol biopolymer transport system component